MTLALMHSKRLLVEGKDEQGVIPHLLDAHFTWGDKEEEWPIWIKEHEGISNLLKAGVIEAECKSSGLKILGILVDANDNLKGRWESVRARCLKSFPDVPDDLPEGGVICKNSRGIKLGIWIMPDNRSTGMLETFLGHLSSEDNSKLWEFAKKATGQAKAKHEAPFSESHRDKAVVRSYLSWLDPPGQSFGVAVMGAQFDPKLPYFEPFLKWFRKLYEI